MNAEILELARVDRMHHIAHGAALCPFSTEGSRDLWQRGFNGVPMHNWEGGEGSGAWRMWARGAAAAHILQHAETWNPGILEGVEAKKGAEK